MTGIRFVEVGAPGATRDEIVVGLSSTALSADQCIAAMKYTFVLVEAEPTSPIEIAVSDLGAATSRLTRAVDVNPLAAATLCGILRSERPVADGLVVESLAYSMLLAGSEFARWRSSRPVRPIPDPTEPSVLLARSDDLLVITLNRPERRNAYGITVRDGLIEGLDLALADETIARVIVRGNGAAFCSGGDLDEFGSSPDPVTAHLIRLDRSAARRMHALRDRLDVELHGACIGAGIELASFAGHVTARADTVAVLPELAMGLIPGAGGTVGITRRIGRWRAAYLALSGAPLSAQAAFNWGLVDELV